MSENDRTFLEANFQNWKDSRGEGLKTKIDPFIYYVAEQYLKPYDPNDEDIAYGLTDGPNDGGVDAIYFVLNRSTFVRDDTPVDRRNATKVRILIFQVKTGADGFKMTEVQKLVFFTDDLLHIQRSTDEMVTKYHAHLLEIMATIKARFLEVVGAFPSIEIDYYYVNKTPDAAPDDKTKGVATIVQNKVRELITQASVNFHFVNANRLLAELGKRPSRSRTLLFSETPMQAKDGYVGLVRLPDYYHFISDGGELAERILEANVRGYQQNTSVNKQIGATLGEKNGRANFWLLNNGITIIAEEAQSAGHLRYSLMDPQIVNGLQTSREIFNYFSERGGTTNEERSILVRVLPTTDEVVRDAVVKATNSQNKMDPASLRAFDQVHHRIEDVFKQHGLYYDRRKGFYKDKGKPANKIVSVMEVLKAIVAIVRQRPDDSRARSGDYIKDDERYASVFGVEDRPETHLPLDAYVKAMQVMRRAEDFLDKLPDVERGDQWNVKFHLAAALGREATHELTPSPEGIASVDLATITDDLIASAYRRVARTYRTLGGTDTVAKGSELTRRLKNSDSMRWYRANREV